MDLIDARLPLSLDLRTHKKSSHRIFHVLELCKIRRNNVYIIVFPAILLISFFSSFMLFSSFTQSLPRKEFMCCSEKNIVVQVQRHVSTPLFLHYRKNLRLLFLHICMSEPESCINMFPGRTFCGLCDA